MYAEETNTLDSLLFAEAPPLSVPGVFGLDPATTIVIDERPHPFDNAKTVTEALHLFSSDAHKRDYKNIKPKLKELSIIAFLMSKPMATTAEICEFFKCGPGVVRAVMNSDMFQHQLALAQQRIFENKEYLNLCNEMAAGAQLASEVVNEALVKYKDPELALKAIGTYTKAMGMGASKVNVTVNTATATADMLKMAREANVIDLWPEPSTNNLLPDGLSPDGLSPDGLSPDGLPQQVRSLGVGSGSGAQPLSPALIESIPYAALSTALYSEAPEGVAAYPDDETFNILDGGLSLTGGVTASLIVPGHVPSLDVCDRP